MLAGATGWEVRAGDTRVVTDAAVTGAAPAAAWIGPGVAGRSLSAAGGMLAECWLVGLDLPAAVWEVSADGGPIALAWVLNPLPADGLHLSVDGTRLAAASTGGPWAEVAVGGGRMRVAREGGIARVVCQGAGSLRVLVAAGSDDADRARTLELLARGTARLAEAWRQQVRSAPKLETPDRAIDEAFTWAWRRAGALAARPDPAGAPPGWTVAALSSAATRFLADPATLDAGRAAAVLDEVSGGLWGVSRDVPNEAVYLRPLLPAGWPAMSLRRLRVGRTLLDLELRRRHGDLVARVHRIFGPPLVVTLEPRGASLETAVVDEVELRGGRARFEAADRHVIVFRGGPA